MPNITCPLANALPKAANPFPNPVKAPSINLPFTNCNNNNAGIAGVSKSKPTDANIKPNDPFNTPPVPIASIPFASPCNDFWNCFPSIFSIAKAPNVPGIIAIKPTEDKIKLPAPADTLPVPIASIPFASPFNDSFSFSPLICSITLAPNVPGIIAIKPTAAAGKPINPPNITFPSPKAFIPAAMFFILSLNPAALSPFTLSAAPAVFPAASVPPSVAPPTAGFFPNALFPKFLAISLILLPKPLKTLPIDLEKNNQPANAVYTSHD